MDAGMSPQEAAVAAASAADKEVTSGAVKAGDLLTSIAAMAARVASKASLAAGVSRKEAAEFAAASADRQAEAALAAADMIATKDEMSEEIAASSTRSSVRFSPHVEQQEFEVTRAVPVPSSLLAHGGGRRTPKIAAVAAETA